MSLQRVLADVDRSFDPEAAAAIAAHIARLAEIGAADRALKVGDTVPNFILPDAHGNAVALRALLMRGRAVIVFYRGSWCPYCSAELAALQLALPEIAARGAHLVAISPEVPDDSLTPDEIDRLTFEVLSDAHNEVARKFGLVYEIDEKGRSLMIAGGVDLERYNRDPSWELPLPATYIVAPDRTVVFAAVDVDFRRRTEPADIVAALDAMGERP